MKKNVRKQGILLPISSIPSTYGIGTFGKESYRFVDFLEKSGNHLWQILPLGPTGYGDSPYQSFSTFAGNPYYIDLELLIEDGYLTKEICDSYDFGDNEHYVDYEKIYLSRFKVLKIAFDNAREQGLTETGDYQKFLTENAYWLDDYALYMAVNMLLAVSSLWNGTRTSVSEKQRHFANTVRSWRKKSHFIASNSTCLQNSGKN